MQEEPICCNECHVRWQARVEAYAEGFAEGLTEGRKRAAADIRASIPDVKDYVWDASAPNQREIAARIAETNAETPTPGPICCNKHLTHTQAEGVKFSIARLRARAKIENDQKNLTAWATYKCAADFLEHND